MNAETTTVEVTPPGRFTYTDLTDELRRAVKDAGVTDGMAVAFCPHTTCALVINEWEEGALQDFRRRLRELVPEEGVGYAHDDLEARTQNLDEGGHERPNGQAHIKAMLLSATSHAIPVSAGEPMLGRWQRLMLVELDDPKQRRVVFHVFGE